MHSQFVISLQSRVMTGKHSVLSYIALRAVLFYAFWNSLYGKFANPTVSYIQV
jgi:hypothetical protein